MWYEQIAATSLGKKIQKIFHGLVSKIRQNMTEKPEDSIQRRTLRQVSIDGHDNVS